MTPRQIPGRRTMLASVALAAPSAAHAIGLVPALSPADALDARLVALAGELRQAEAHYSALMALEAPSATPEAERAASLRIVGLVGVMAALPAAGLVGIAAKAGRLCLSLKGQPGGGLMTCEDGLAESLAADLARLVPHAVGVNA